MAVVCGTDKPRCDVFSNMLLVSVGVVISSYGEIHFNVVGTVYQVTGIFAEALRLVLTQVLLQKKGLTLNPITSLYYIAPCRYILLNLDTAQTVIVISSANHGSSLSKYITIHYYLLVDVKFYLLY